ncbi:MAG: bifunctional UDP-4-keto-pentose/UDP-xylose synthase [Alphaproteobacteria bacterium]
MSLKVLILGINGFIGSALTRSILNTTDWEVYGMDLDNHKLSECLSNPNLHFSKRNILTDQEWIEDHVQKCDVVLPLVAIANPMLYVQKPLQVFELDFESNLSVVRYCVKHKKRIIFPSTSEVYGMCPDKEFDEETSNLVLGPIHKQRWIYSCAKQMMDRVIFAYGIHEDLDYTLFRPFNWLGPRMDDVYAAKANSSRAAIQFISNVLYGRPIQLMDGGSQKRCFTYVEEGVDALMRMIRNKDGKASQRIFNVGNPKNNHSMKEVAEMIVETFKELPDFKHLGENAVIESLSAAEHFGKHYEDVPNRVPAIKNAQEYLGWNPEVTLKEILQRTLDYHLVQHPQEIVHD